MVEDERTGISFSGVVESEPPQWEPEPLPLCEQLPRPTAAPPARHREDVIDPEQVGARVIVIDLT